MQLQTSQGIPCKVAIHTSEILQRKNSFSTKIRLKDSRKVIHNVSYKNKSEKSQWSSQKELEAKKQHRYPLNASLV